MITIIWILAALVFVEGITFLVNPQLYKKIAGIVKKGKLPWLAALLRIAIGIFLLIAATKCEQTVIIVIIGLIMVAAGIAMFAMGIEKLKNMIAWFMIRPDWQIRALAILAILFSGLLIYAAGKPIALQ